MAATLAFAQTTGNVSGVVTDGQGRAVPNVTVQIENTATGARLSATTDSSGRYRLDSLAPGRYRISTVSTGVTSTPGQEFDVTTAGGQTVNLALPASGPATDAFSAQAVAPNTTTATDQIRSHWNTRYIQYLPQPNFTDKDGSGNGAYNLGLLTPATANTPFGPVVGGQRPSTNNFHIDGIDNNNLVRTGRLVYQSNEASQEFTLMQNPFLPEFGHTSGGKWNTITRSGSNQAHGALYWYLQNRNLNAWDRSLANTGLTEQPRYDQNRLGASLGVPVIPSRMFFFGNFEYIPVGFSNIYAGGPALVPTQTGFNALAGLSGVSSNNLNVLRNNAGFALNPVTTTTINGVSIPLGYAQTDQRGWRNQYNGTGAMDFRITDRDQLNLRYIHNESESSTAGFAFSPFQTPWNDRSLMANGSWNHSFASLVTNQLRFGYTRFDQNFNLLNRNFPGLSAFPNISIGQENLSLGRNVATTNSIINTYHLADSLAFNLGAHELRVGFDGRRVLGRLSGFGTEQGNYGYSSLARFLADLPPDVTSQRTFNAGGIDPANYSLFGYVMDRWQIRPSLTAELGVRYQWVSVPNFVKRQQDLAAGLGVPGTIEFRRPSNQTTNFAPRVGLAWSPGFSRPTVIRAGFGADYDALYSYMLSPLLTQQVGTLVSGNLNSNSPGFLAGGGVQNPFTGSNLTLQQQRAGLTSWFGEQKLPYSMQWNAAFQQTVWPSFTIELKYLGARNRRLPLFSYLNSASAVTATNSLPLYLSQPTQAQLNALPLTLNQLQAQSNNPLAQFGFTSPIATVQPVGNSDYHAGVVAFSQRFKGGVQVQGNYTWSHLIDDIDQSMSNFSGIRERGNSIFDRRHIAQATVFWELAPLFRNTGRWTAQFFTDFAIAGTYNFQSAGYYTAMSAGNAGLTGYGLGSRAIYNAGGAPGVGSGVSPLTNSLGQTVAYLANNPNAQYFAAAPGLFANGPRNTLGLGEINNFNVAAFKKFSVRERFSFELRGDAYNLLNKPQYTFTNLTAISPMMNGSMTPSFLNPANMAFGNAAMFAPSNGRVLQVGLRANF